MKILISSTESGWNADMDGRFGRAMGFVLYDEESKELSWHSNEENLNAAHGAGPKAAEFAINTGASVLISSHVGPKAFDVLKHSDIKIFLASEKTIKEVYEAYKRGELKQQDH